MGRPNLNLDKVKVLLLAELDPDIREAAGDDGDAQLYAAFTQLVRNTGRTAAHVDDLVVGTR